MDTIFLDAGQYARDLHNASIRSIPQLGHGHASLTSETALPR
jgi:hypothetical protein